MTASTIPVTVLTGFLGAGKTTLLNRILSERHGQRIAIIENEFGPVSVDNQLLVTDVAEQIIEMNNGCICCTVRGDLIRILRKLHLERQTGTLAFDRVVIETTGLADPGPVTQSFFTDSSVARAYLLDGVITVVDAKHGHATLDQHLEAQRQVGFADRILISKSDMVSAGDVASLRSRLIQMNPRAPILSAHMGQVPLSDIWDLHGFNLSAILEIDPEFLSIEHAQAEAYSTGLASPHPPATDHNRNEVRESVPHEPADARERHSHHDDAIKAFVYRSDRPFNPRRLQAYLDDLSQRHGQDMLRYKGVLYLAGEKRRGILQGVHAVIGLGFGRGWAVDEIPASTMVFIGRNLPQGAFAQGLAACLAQ
jgi:G3E family GTPase